MFGIFKRKQEPRPRVIHRNVSVKMGRAAFDAAGITNLFSGWQTQTMPINAELENELRQLRARSRQLAKNNPYLKRFFQLCRTNVVGPAGFALRSEVTRKTSGKPAGLEREAIEKGWTEFSKKGVACALDRFTMRDIQNLAITQLVRDGEIILVEYRGRDENKFGISFRFLDPELMDVNHKEKYRGNNVRMGVETDRRGRVVAYHFHSTDTTHETFYKIGGKGYIRIAKKFVIHEFLSDYVDQIRGYPEAAAAMARLRMFDGYEEAELVAARVGASTTGLIERGETGAGFEGDGTISDTEDGDVYEYEDPVIQADPGTFHYIDKGAKLHTFDPNHPNNAYQAYVKTILRGIASGLGVDYNTLANDLEGVNFSSLRGGVLESREYWKALQDWFIEHVLTEIFDRWLESALLSGALKLPRGDSLPSSKIDDYKAHSFQGRRWAWVDPVKDLQAAKLAIDEGLTSRSEVMREQGRDPEQVWREIQRETELMEKYGIKTAAAQAKPEEDQDQDQEDKPDQDQESEDDNQGDKPDK